MIFMITALAIAFDSVFTKTFFGNSLLQIGLFAISVLLSIIFGRLVLGFFKSHAKKITEKTNTRIDDILLETIDKSSLLILFALGLTIGLQFLSLDAATFLTLQKIFWVAITVIISWVLIQLVDSFAGQYIIPIVPIKKSASGKIDENLIIVFKNIFKAIILIFAVVFILNDFGYDVTAILAGLGIGGIAIAFAAQQTISDVFGGISLITSKPFLIGDTIQVGNIIGTVKKIGIRTTRIKGIDNSEITFSNTNLASSIIKNLSSVKEQRVELNISLSNNNSHEKIALACDLIKKAILVHDGCEDDPTVFFWDYKENASQIQAIYFIKEKDWMKVRHEINLKIKQEFEKNKIELAQPIALA